MKRIYTLLLFLLATVSILAQSPEKMSYQAVLRDASNTLLTNQEVGMQISILQSTITGVAVYIETQTTTTNINGLVSIAIGSGTSSDNFSTIDWSAGPYFIKTATDPSGGSSYSITGTSQLMSVPFAMYATTSGSAAPGPQGVAGAQGIQGATGTAGTNGINGEKGDTGDQGTQGVQGNTGSVGAVGATGTNGAKGDTGIIGDRGDVGEKGDTGDQGIQGIQGNIGSVGVVGATGTNGTNGAKGDVGEKGIQGIQGATGADGASGAIGATGADGASGETGAMGDMGTTGLQGASGAQGEIGATGPSGATGNTGNTGVGIAQTLSFTSPNLVLSDNGGSIDLTGLINDADSDNSNEIQNLSQVITQGNSAGAQLKDVTDPTNAQDATTKAYVDALIEALEARIVSLEQSQGATVGDLRDGGVVFWVDPDDNTQGLVCALQDYPNTVEWGCYGTDLPSVPNVTNNLSNPVGLGAEIGDGEDNTTGILADCSSSPAALAARSYGPEWFLPSINELNQMFTNKATINTTASANGGSNFAINYYWSSTEYDSNNAWLQNFNNGSQYGNIKSHTSFSMRAVRAF
jgi:hypothetical protein